MEPAITLVCTAEEREPEAERLARALGIPRATNLPAGAEELALVLTRERLELRRGGRSAPGPVAAELDAGGQRQRGARASIRSEALARAAGLGRGWRPEVLDATAGLGRDSFLLATLGCTVTSCERNPIVAALLADGLERARRDPATRAAAQRIHLLSDDARDVLASSRADVVLVDPMHPPRSKSAAVKKDMRLLQQLLGPDNDGAGLLAAARAAARRRVVVKRPRREVPLAGPAPTYSITGRSTRFDVYVAPMPTDTTDERTPAAPSDRGPGTCTDGSAR